MQYLVSLMLRVVEWESRLRRGQLTVSHLRYELDESVRILKILFDLMKRIEHAADCGDVLDEIAAMQASYSHIAEINGACEGLLIAGFEQYLRVVVDYCCQGSTESDIYDEIFMKRINSDVPVEGIRAIPKMFKPYTDSIVRSGRNSWLMRKLRCTPTDIVPPDPSKFLSYEFAGRDFFSQCLSRTSAALYEAVNIQHPIEGSIEWFHQYMLLGRSDWFLDLLDRLSPELEKPTKHIDRSKLSEYLVSLPGAPTCDFHVFQIEDIFGPGGSFRTSHELLYQQDSVQTENMLGTKSFTLNPSIKFPLSLIFPDSTIFKFQTVFRIISHVVIVSKKLRQLWLRFQTLKVIGDGCVLFSANILLKRMMHVVENLLYYLQIDVVAASKRKLSRQINEGEKDIDHVKDCVSLLVDEILMGCCISPSCVRATNKVLGTCSLFASHMTRFVNMHGNSHEENLVQITQEEQYIGLIAKFEDAFDGQLNSLLVQLKQHVSADRSRALALVAKIDYNAFYSESIGL